MTFEAIVAHLWQSTLFAAVPALLTFATRKNHARVRYWLWFSATLKFLVPFSMLVWLGHRISALGGTAIPDRRLRFVIEVVASSARMRTLPIPERVFPLLFAAWLGGAVTVLCVWALAWRRALSARRNAVLLSTGREWLALQRAERALGMRGHVDLMLTSTALEPGILGFFRPVLLWPEGISHRLDDAQLDAVMVHELWHVRRRDNLLAATQMVVQAMFWFHPLVWWMGARLVEERERDCDEVVLALGNDRQSYAESILKVCEFCLVSPLPCMPGVAGSDLKKRMVNIMINSSPRQLSLAGKLTLGVVAFAVVVLPLTLGAANATNTRSAPTANPLASQADSSTSTQATQEEMRKLIAKKVQPTYPEAAKQAGIQGEVVLKASINKNGDVERLDVVSGPAELASAAVEAVRQWKYRPFMKDGHPVAVETQIHVNFTLEK